MPINSEEHMSFILTDAAFPLSSFSFSYGLESYLSHQPKRNREAVFTFLCQSLASLVHTNMPSVKAGWTSPTSYEEIDDFFESTQTCVISQRTSVTQGKALLGIWTKSLAFMHKDTEVAKVLSEYVEMCHEGKVQGHFPVVWGVTCRALGLSLERCCYLFLLGHVKSICSAAVRMDVLSSFQFVTALMHAQTQALLKTAVQQSLELELEDTAQTWAPLDLWQGRHSLLYSRIFNS
ncbi:urease accessory protein UreF [Schizosaccharomyces japonicus yFS275]|uniref:Urease accessory protein UreF n=1 Tax=Schizosaccharomyces japonicus (strain yFS275 / FY16936) TaxID=402676 RepID=B6K7P7_SCHJY|nr:urease accessory protein UreF [Schizosaccharomyces japonicus yFS275]EEB09551.1 urease accessory protein UreF [Schizosaccharomyces japonicus yFS275]